VAEEAVPLIQTAEWQERVLLRHEKETLGLRLLSILMNLRVSPAAESVRSVSA